MQITDDAIPILILEDVTFGASLQRAEQVAVVIIDGRDYDVAGIVLRVQRANQAHAAAIGQPQIHQRQIEIVPAYQRQCGSKIGSTLNLQCGKRRLHTGYNPLPRLGIVFHNLVKPEYFFIVAYSFHLAGTLALGAIVYRVASQALRFRQRQAVIITGALAIQITLFVHNIYLMFFAPSARWEGSIFYAHFGIPLLFMIFIGSLLSRFNGALETAENLNRELEQKVELSRQVIEKSFAERRVLEIQQAAEQERLKIYRDLHDDVGSKLLSIMHADRGSKLGDMARSALESLRQAVSKANNPDQMLASFIDDIREETELRLRGSGHEVEWTQSAEMPTVIIPSTVAFNLNRILKEIVSNIISRAKEIGASVSWHSEPGQGTTICTVVPTG